MGEFHLVPAISLVTPSFPPPPSPPPSDPSQEPASTTGFLIRTLDLLPHIEGGFFAETDRDPLRIPSPWPSHAYDASTAAAALVPQRDGFEAGWRNASTSIYYLLTKNSPQGNFHRNRGRTVHTLHRGRGRYVVLHPPAGAEGDGGWDDGTPGEHDWKGKGKWTLETFEVGPNVAKGERIQWIVEGGRYKASFLLPDEEESGEQQEAKSGGLLISETVVPGFEYCDHDFLTRRGLKELVDGEMAEKLEWLVRRG